MKFWCRILGHRWVPVTVGYEMTGDGISPYWPYAERCARCGRRYGPRPYLRPAAEKAEWKP